jgi:hypothetical protein
MRNRYGTGLRDPVQGKHRACEYDDIAIVVVENAGSSGHGGCKSHPRAEKYEERAYSLQQSKGT